jgi:hypothetical protein
MANCKSKYGGKDYKNSQEYHKFITNIRSSQEKFPLKDAPKLVKYQTVVNQGLIKATKQSLKKKEKCSLKCLG